jgi:glycosyltransferase involved in cell wall biosynthesis
MSERVAVICGAPAGLGGWGYHVGTVLDALAGNGVELHAYGPKPHSERWCASAEAPIIWHEQPVIVPSWVWLYTPLRWRKGLLSGLALKGAGRWAAREIKKLRPDYCYTFNLVGLETLEWAAHSGAIAVMDSPMGHISHYRGQCDFEARAWSTGPYYGFPDAATVARGEEEYRTADRIRVSSEWTRRSLVVRGVPAERVDIVSLPVDLQRFTPPRGRPAATGPLRVCYVGAINLAKGFAHLLRAIRALGTNRVSLNIVGASGDRQSRKLLERESAGLDVRFAPGDPIPTYHTAELLVLPSLHDGFGMVVAEAMASELPVIVTEECGSAELVSPGVNGWVVPARDIYALTAALEDALAKRVHLREMGRAARAKVQRFAVSSNAPRLRSWFYRNADIRGVAPWFKRQTLQF